MGQGSSHLLNQVPQGLTYTQWESLLLASRTLSPRPSDSDIKTLRRFLKVFLPKNPWPLQPSQAWVDSIHPTPPGRVQEMLSALVRLSLSLSASPSYEASASLSRETPSLPAPSPPYNPATSHPSAPQPSPSPHRPSSDVTDPPAHSHVSLIVMAGGQHRRMPWTLEELQGIKREASQHPVASEQFLQILRLAITLADPTPRDLYDLRQYILSSFNQIIHQGQLLLLEAGYPATTQHFNPAQGALAVQASDPANWQLRRDYQNLWIAAFNNWPIQTRNPAWAAIVQGALEPFPAFAE